MKLNFNSMSNDEFAKLENKAIDGQLNYDDFPPEEYKYFSKLSKLGYFNRHKGWSAEICENEQRSIKRQYISEKSIEKKLCERYGEIQNDLIKASGLITQIYKATSEYQMLDYALQVIELITQENGFVDRIKKRIKGFYE